MEQDGIKAVRDEQENEKFAEWNEWLADQLRRFQTDAKPPAHQRYRDWNP